LRDGIPLEKALWVETRSGGVVRGEDVLREARKAMHAGKPERKRAA
jgi:hypothetical protein